jgi:2-dehydro-3-deoxyphosphogluconate aldolase/(4S)-4-hydroxy-2-oxoglutarate aldolase
MFEAMNEKIEKSGLLAVLKIEDPSRAAELADALRKGGIRMAEVAFRSTDGEQGIVNVLESIRAMVRACPDMIVGASTVINAGLAERAVQAGAAFIVAPGFNPETVDWCIGHTVPVYPGVSNAGQIEAALSRGLTVLKFFPAEASGGTKVLDAFEGPFPQVRFIATGGITEENVSDYMRCRNVAAVGGSWVAPAALIAEKKWDEITRKSKAALVKMLGFRFAHVGINFDSPQDCAEGAALLDVFGFEGQETPASWFSGDSFELMKKNGRGVHGHIGFFVWNIERALEYLSLSGFSPVMETAVWSGEPEKSSLTFVYLDKGIAGFDIHLKKAL